MIDEYMVSEDILTVSTYLHSYNCGPGLSLIMSFLGHDGGSLLLTPFPMFLIVHSLHSSIGS